MNSEQHYIYLISSLPMLHFGTKPPFSFARFVSMCHSLIPDEDIDMIKTITLDGAYSYKGEQPTLRKWRSFDTALRNELVRIRAGRKHIDPSKFLRGEDEAEISINHIAINAVRNPSILEGERMLDQARWHTLDEFSIGHYFDIDILIIYAIKLLMLEKWERMASSDKLKLVEEAVAKG